MFRYRDSHGAVQTLATESELRAAIRDGRIQQGTPLAQGNGGWSSAARHPIYADMTRRMAAASEGARRRAMRSRMERLTSRRSVRLAPLVLVLLGSIGFTVNVYRERALNEQKHAYAAAMLGLAHERAPVPELVAADPPESRDVELRQRWVKLQVAHELWRDMLAAREGTGMTGFFPPAGWMSDDYVLDARAFPAIGEHWDAYLRWDRQWAAASLGSRVLTLTWARGADAGLSERESLDVLDADLPGLSVLGWDLDLRREFALEAQRLHAALVESRGNAYIDRGEWWFADTRTQRAYAAHVRNLRRIAEQLEERSALRAQRLGLESIDAAVPAAVHRMRPAGS